MTTGLVVRARGLPSCWPHSCRPQGRPRLTPPPQAQSSSNWCLPGLRGQRLLQDGVVGSREAPREGLGLSRWESGSQCVRAQVASLLVDLPRGPASEGTRSEEPPWAPAGASAPRLCSDAGTLVRRSLLSWQQLIEFGHREEAPSDLDAEGPQRLAAQGPRCPVKPEIAPCPD